MLKTEKSQELGESFISLIEDWKKRLSVKDVNRIEDTFVDPHLLADEVLSSGIIQKYLNEKHLKPSEV